MIVGLRLHGYLAAILSLVVLPAAAGVVTVSVTDASGSAAQDAAVVFDSLDDAPPPGRATAVIDQVNKTYVPHVSVIRTGTAVTFPNSDRIHHQVYSFSPAKTFQMDLYRGASSAPVLFDKPGLVVLGCNIHDSMLAYVLVVDTPYFTRASSAGIATLDLPPGHYSLRTWHPDLAAAAPARRITVTAEPLDISVRMDLSGSADSLTTWR
jgi:plastocyanin